MPYPSAFPTTQATWLLTLVRACVADESSAKSAAIAQVFVMDRYAGPLAVFVRGSSLARLGEPAEIVNGFFASRLSDAEFLRAWDRSGMRLRRWLMNGILFYGQGLARDGARANGRSAMLPAAEWSRLEGEATTAEVDFERAWAMAVVREATARAENELHAEGRTVDFEIFRRHAIDGQPYAAFARELGRSEQQCAGATRLVAQRVRVRVAELLREEGVPEAEIDDEIARVRAAL